MITTPKNLTDQLTITLLVCRPTFNGMTVQAHANGIIAGTHSVLDHSEFESMFGADNTDISLVTEFVEQAGLTVDHAHSLSASVIAKGTVGQINTLFRITLNDVVDTHKTYINYTGSVTLPSNIADIVEHIDGLDTSMIAVRPAPPRPATTPSPATAPYDPDFPYITGLQIPQKIATAYNFPGHNDGTDGVGQVVGLIEPFASNSGFTQQNLASTFGFYGVSVPNVIPVFLDGTVNQPDGGAAIETMLDIAAVGGIVPKATILMYSSDGYISAFNAALYDTQNTGYFPTVLSISAGGSDIDNANLDYYSQVDSLLAQAVVLGVTVCVSSGDWGPYNNPVYWYDRAWGTSWPASSPYVLAVGGTSLALKPDGSRSSEVVWNPSGTDYYITGGNQSGRYPVPSWQAGLTLTRTGVGSIPTALTGRGTPDVAMVADPYTGISFYFGYSNELYNYGGGTSMSSPLFAGLIARINQIVGKPVGFVNSKFYSNPGAFNDILPQPIYPGYSVDNNAYNGAGFMNTVGWDAGTGLGRPIGTKILSLFTGTTTNTATANIQVKTNNTTWQSIGTVRVKTNTNTWSNIQAVYTKTANGWSRTF